MAKPSNKKQTDEQPKETQVTQPAEEKKELVVAASTAVAVAPNLQAMMEEDAGAGQENMTAKDFLIPRIGIIQSLSPQRQQTKPEFIPGATEGQIFDNVFKKLIDGAKGMYVIPIQFQLKHLEWKPRAKGGGLVADHGSDPSIEQRCTKDDLGKWFLGENNVIPTAEYYVFLVDVETGAITRAVLSMAGTQFKHAKRWNTIMNQLQLPKADGTGTYNPPMYAMSYHFTTVPESNEKGQWFRWEMKQHKMLGELPNAQAIYDEARKFRASIKAGEVKVSEHNADAPAGESDKDPM